MYILQKCSGKGRRERAAWREKFQGTPETPPTPPTAPTPLVMPPSTPSLRFLGTWGEVDLWLHARPLLILLLHPCWAHNMLGTQLALTSLLLWILHDKLDFFPFFYGGGVTWSRRVPTFTVWSPECVHPASQPPTFTLYTNNTPDSPHLHPGNTPRPKGLVPHAAKPTARFHLIHPECPSCGSPPPPCPQRPNLLHTPEFYRLLGGSTRSLGSLSSSCTTRGGSVSSGEESNTSLPITVEELHYAISAAINARTDAISAALNVCTDASNLHGAATDSVKNARLAVHSQGLRWVLCFCCLPFFFIHFLHFCLIFPFLPSALHLCCVIFSLPYCIVAHFPSFLSFLHHYCTVFSFSLCLCIFPYIFLFP